MITCPEKTDTTSKNVLYKRHIVKGLLNGLIKNGLVKTAYCEGS